MSTDIASMHEEGPLAQVREGMTVVDAAGEDVGKVDYVKMGDPEAATTEGQVMDREDTLVDDFAEAFGADDEPDVPEPLRSQLLRFGFIKVGGGFLGRDHYIHADQVAGVSSDTVRLSVAKDALT